MGQTLHYTIAKDDCRPFTEAEYDRIMATSIRYTSDQFRDIWTCENFWADPLDCVSNRARGHTHESLERRWKQLAAEGLSPFRIAKEGIAQPYEPDRVEKSVARGFVKVQGNETNALLVITALAGVAAPVPNATITLSDEGRFLLCRIRLKGGKAQPELTALKQDIEGSRASAAYGDKGIGVTLVVKAIDADLLSDMMPYLDSNGSAVKHAKATIQCATSRA